MQTGIADMLVSTENLEWRSELDYANRAFAAMIGGQRYENITREEAKRLCQPRPAHKKRPRRTKPARQVDYYNREGPNREKL